MRRNDRWMFHKHAWAMLVLIPVLVTIVSWFVMGMILDATAFSGNLSENLSLGVPAFLGILSYVGIAFCVVLDR